LKISLTLTENIIGLPKSKKSNLFLKYPIKTYPSPAATATATATATTIIQINKFHLLKTIIKLSKNKLKI
jgi:hypothetical protein